MATGTFRLPISAGTPTPPVGEWTKPADWPDISDVANNEINLLVSDAGLATVAFKVIVTGGYTVNWGDGTVTNYASDALAQHTYTVGAGAPCSRGYTTFKIRIYAQNSANSITRFYVQPEEGARLVSYQWYLWAVFGTTGLTSLNYMFKNYGGSPAVTCRDLERTVYPTTLNSASTAIYTHYDCPNLTGVVMPNSMSACGNFNSFASVCPKLSALDMPSVIGSGASLDGLCSGDSGLLRLTVTPNSRTASYNRIIANCYSLTGFNNADTLGSTTSAADLSSFGDNAMRLGSLSLTGKLNSFKLTGQNATNAQAALSSLRLINATSPFGGTSPQIDISYCSLDATALNTLFGDLPTLTGKTIKITGNPGAATCDRTIATGRGWTVTG